ncbi:MAG: AsmA-like C-terminal region-containing protein [Bacteroidia bacterium]
MIKKIIYAVLGLILLIIIAAVSIPILFKDKIVAKVKEEINNNINAKVDFGSFDLSLIKHFPSLSFSLNDLSVVGVKEFEGDTLTFVKSLDIGVNFWSIISGSQISIKSITVGTPYINILVLENGKANYDIAKNTGPATGSSESSSFKMNLQHYEINNGTVIYNDRSIGFSMMMYDLNHSGSGDFTQDLFTLNTKTNVDGISLIYGGVKYLSSAKTEIKADLEMDMKNSKYTFKDNEIKINELILGLDGWLAMPGNDITMDLKWDAKKNDFKNFISMIPGVYSESFKDVKSSGTMSLNGFVKGTYNDKKMPGFGLNVLVQNGMFKYPDLPTAVNNVNMDLKINNADGVPDHTIINLSKLHAEMGSDPFDARLLVKTPVSNADIDMMAKGKIDLGNISKIVPLEQGTTLSGMLLADMTAKGRMSAIEQKRYEDFNASGSMKLTGMNYVSKEYKDGIKINNCELTFNPKNIGLNNFDMKAGTTDIKANGTLDNLLGYYFKKEMLKGFLNLTSNQIDLNPFMTSTSTGATTAPDTATLTVMEIPANVDFIVTTAIGKVLYENLVLQNVKGTITVKEKNLGMNDVKFEMLDGSVAMNGLYSTKDIKNPLFNYSLNAQNMDVKKTYTTFNSVQKMAPIAGKCSGKYSTEFTVTGKLDGHMQPVMNSLNGAGKLKTTGITIENFEPLNKVADALKMPQFKKASLSDANLSFKFTNGRVYIDPYEQAIAGIKTKIEGSNGFDQTIDYKLGMQLPTKMIPGAATSVINGLISQANSHGANMSMGENVNVNVKIGGTVQNPKIETGLKEAVKGAVDDLKAKAQEEFEKKKKELEDRAKATADSLKNAAETKVKAEADRIKKEAEAKVKSETERLRKEAAAKAKKAAEDQMKNIFNKPK